MNYQMRVFTVAQPNPILREVISLEAATDAAAVVKMRQQAERLIENMARRPKGTRLTYERFSLHDEAGLRLIAEVRPRDIPGKGRILAKG
jgi:hypothetical protein